MKKLFFASLIVLTASCNFLFAQTAVEKKVGTLKTYDGELISMYDYASKDADSWSFHDENGKFKNIKSKKIAWMMMGSRRYLNHNTYVQRKKH